MPLAFIRTECPPAVAGGIAGPGRSSDFRPARARGPDGRRPRCRRAADGCRTCSSAPATTTPPNFGLMSVAEWDGVPLDDVVSRLQPARARRRCSSAASITTSASSAAPRRRELGVPARVARSSRRLPRRPHERRAAAADHGQPVRLVVPGWYGCAWIKWVNEIRLVGADEPATSQMKEFAGRTHQTARHDLARDYAPPDIQTAAMPIRVEKRRTAAGLEYRIVGIVWGGTEARRSAGDPFRRRRSVDAVSRSVPHPRPTPSGRCGSTGGSRRPGFYASSLRVPNPAAPQRRLATGYSHAPESN